jgi:ferric-dicitrate binding protein FerR (iron transport regulator)
MSNDLMRRKLQALAREDSVVLDAAARDRIIQNVVAAAPLEMRRARTMRLATGGGVALAAAAAVALFVGLGADALRGSSSPASPGAQDLPTAPTPLRACADRPLPAALAFVERDSEKVLQVGDLARVVASADSRVALDHAEPCNIVVTLEAGGVAVRAPDLRGGELRIRARNAEVVVHGAQFALTQGERDLTVEVTEGRVFVERHAMGQREVSAGRRMRLSDTAVVESQIAR